MKSPKGKAGKAKKGTFRRLIKELFSSYKWPIIIAMIFIIVAAVSNFTSSIFVKNITSAIETSLRTGTDPWVQLVPILIEVGIIYIAGLIGSFVWNLTMGITTQKFLNYLRKKVFDHMETLPIKYFDTHAHGDIMSVYTNDIDTIRQLISQSLPTLFQASFTIVALLIIMMSFSIWLMIIVILGTVFMFLNIKLIGGKSAKYFMKQQMD